MANDVHLLDRVLEIALLIQADLDRELGRHGLTSSRTHLLWELHRLGPSTQQALAAALQVSARNVTGLVDALEAGGFVARGPHPTDRRATLVSLTKRGTKIMKKMERDRREFAAQLVEGFEPDGLAQLSHGLDALTERLRVVLGASEVASGRNVA
jgi:DNA-binding MarR family transcriptional regulator